MIGAIIGDIVGSRFEWDNHRSKDFDFLTHKCFFTDDSVMSLAICDALLHCKPDYSDLRIILLLLTTISKRRNRKPFPRQKSADSILKRMKKCLLQKKRCASS